MSDLSDELFDFTPTYLGGRVAQRSFVAKRVLWHGEPLPSSRRIARHALTSQAKYACDANGQV